MQAILDGDAGSAIRSYIGWTQPYDKEQLLRAVFTRRERYCRELVIINGSADTNRRVRVRCWCGRCGEHTARPWIVCTRCGA